MSLSIKAYWRTGGILTRPHLYRRVGNEFRSYCGKGVVMDRIGSQYRARPPEWIRCAKCSRVEVEIHAEGAVLEPHENWREHVNDGRAK